MHHTLIQIFWNIHVDTHICTVTCMQHICIHMRTNTWMCSMKTCIHTYIYIHTYIHTHTHTHIYIYIYIYTPDLQAPANKYMDTLVENRLGQRFSKQSYLKVSCDALSSEVWYVHVSMYVCLYGCMDARMHVHVCLHACACVVILWLPAVGYVHVSMYVCLYGCMYACMHVHVCMHVCMFICMYACVW
jgi:hypothetical protein